MERMINLARALDDERLIEKIEELEKENKNLKSDLEQFSEAYKRYRDFEKEELAESCYDLEKENKKLKEKVETLELCLDNKEKLNEEYRKQIDRLRTDNVYEEGLYD